MLYAHVFKHFKDVKLGHLLLVCKTHKRYVLWKVKILKLKALEVKKDNSDNVW